MLNIKDCLFLMLLLVTFCTWNNVEESYRLSCVIYVMSVITAYSSSSSSLKIQQWEHPVQDFTWFPKQYTQSYSQSVVFHSVFYVYLQADDR